MSEAEVESYLGVVLQLSGAKQSRGGTTQRFVSQRRKKPKS